MAAAKPVKSRASIRDVADAAGVSRAAVSLVLNGGPIRIGDEKRRRIIEVAREMNYTPHVGARRLALRRMETLGLVIPDQAGGLTEYDLFELTQHIALTARESNYDLLLHYYDAAEIPSTSPNEGRVDGSIVVLGHKNGPDIESIWAKSDQPHIVVGGGFFLQKPENFVDIDLASGLTAATNHLIELGHTDIAYVTSFEQSAKRNGYLVALTQANIPIRKEYIMEIGFTEAALRKAAAAIRDMPGRPTGLVFTSDAVALRMMRIFRELGLSIPGDLSITGFDNIETASFVVPGLTSVKVPTQRMAELAVSQLIAMVEKKGPSPLQSLLPAELVIRDSSAAPALINQR
jgi:DNA-binding LacI/PurR family transcriptional regulator